LARQAAVRARWSGEVFGEALGAVVRTEAGRQLQELRVGPHGSERAYEWQENLVRSRAEARVAQITDTSFLENHLLFTASFQSTEDGLWWRNGVYYGKEAAFQQAWREQHDRWAP
jgi:hypothetical protein